VTISRVENPSKLRSPFELKKSVLKTSPDATDARLLPLGDVRVYFPSNEKVLCSLNSKADTFGVDAKVGRTYEIGHKAVIHNDSSLKTEENIKESLQSMSCNTDFLKIVGNRNYPTRAKVFVTLTSKEERDRLVSKGNIAIGFEIHRVSAYDRPKIIQCYKCQGFGHVSRTCNKSSKCLHCAGDHRSIDCNQKEVSSKIKCVNCTGKHKSNSTTCPKYKEKTRSNVGRSIQQNGHTKKEILTKKKAITESISNDKPAEAMKKLLALYQAQTQAYIIKSTKDLSEQFKTLYQDINKNSNEA
jgi:hypothetical protein